MKILVHDYAGHPFQVSLSKELKKLGHEVVHAYFSEDKGPKGDMESRDIRFEAITIPGSYSKSNFISRRFGDLKYGKKVGELINNFRPHIVLSGNTPTEAQEIILQNSKKINAAFVYWCQDFYSIAAATILERKIPLIGNIVGHYYKYLDKKQMEASDHIVLITKNFLEQIRKWEISEDKVSVIENWGPLEEIQSYPKDNKWTREHHLNPNKVRGIYTGTLALKHNPEILLNAAINNPNVEIVIVGFGVGYDYLKEIKTKPENLILIPIQPFDRYSEVLASSDFCIAIIEEEAGRFSTPSKTLSYLCAGKPILISAPKNNLASMIISENKCGLVSEPFNEYGIADGIKELLSQDNIEEMSFNSRTYAENYFIISKITNKFLDIFKRVIKI